MTAAMPYQLPNHTNAHGNAFLHASQHGDAGVGRGEENIPLVPTARQQVMPASISNVRDASAAMTASSSARGSLDQEKSSSAAQGKARESVENKNECVKAQRSNVQGWAETAISITATLQPARLRTWYC